MFRALPEEVQIDDDGKCKSCGSRVDSYSRYGVWAVWLILGVPGMLALSSKTREWSVEYLPDISDTPIHYVFFPALGLMFALMFYVSRRYGKPAGQWAVLLLIPIILFSVVAGVRHDPTLLISAVDRLDEQTARLERKASEGAFAAKDVRFWFKAQSLARSILEHSTKDVGSIRIAVYSYAIDAASKVFYDEPEAEFRGRHKAFWRKLDRSLSPHLVPDFVRCYREADARGLSQRGVLRTEKFKACFGSLELRP